MLDYENKMVKEIDKLIVVKLYIYIDIPKIKKIAQKSDARESILSHFYFKTI